MKPKTALLITLVTVLSMLLLPAGALAGSKQRHRWEGVAMGVGAAILGHAIYEAHHPAPRNHVVYVRPEREPKHRGRGKHHPDRGHWEWQKIWVPPVTERVWNPGHYNHHGHWVKGRWVRVVAEAGHWSRQRVRAAGRSCRR